MRKVFAITVSVLWMAILFVPMFPVMMVGFPSRRWRMAVAHTYASWWSRGSLLAAGVRLEVRGREHLQKPAVCLFNHTNIVDFFVNSIVSRYGTLVFGKRELTRVPFVGWMWLFGGHPMIKRKDRGQWQGLLNEVEALIKTGNYCTLIAPEGHRSRDGKLLPFKKGAFHMALNTRAPVIPFVLKGPRDVIGSDGVMRPGTVEVVVLPPIPTVDWEAERLDEHIEEVRRLYLRELGQDEEQPANQP